MKKSNGHGWTGCCCSGSGFAVLLIIVGGFFLLRDLGVVASNISFWTVAILALGIFLLVSKYRKTC